MLDDYSEPPEAIKTVFFVSGFEAVRQDQLLGDLL